MKRLIAALLAATFASVAVASDWRDLLHTPGLATYDAATLKVTGEIVSFSEMLRFPSERPLYNGRKFNNRISQKTIYCATRQYSATDMVWKLADEKVGELDAMPVQNIKPDTLDEVEARRFCPTH